MVTTHGIGPETVAAIVEGADRARSKEIINTIDVAPGHVLEFDFVPLPHNTEYELDFHRPYIDEVVFSCDCGGDLKRVPEVFDCWYESGSMPYGQFHYPFDTKKFDPKKNKGYPADFIAEGLDQTRGWFYSMLVLGVALFGKSPYERVIVNGLILAEDGQKMSKKLKNYTDPVLIANRYGADALRYYLLMSPVVRSEDFSFSDKGVDEISKKIIVRLENVLSFYELYATETTAKPEKSNNVLDQWILTRLHELTKEVTESMDTYELDRATRPFLLFVDDLSTWYLRRSRERFKSDDESDKNFALATTRHVLRETAKLLAPFMPFLAEHLFLRLQEKKDAESVHLEMWPKIEKINENIIKQMQDVRALVTRGLEARSRAGIKVRQPLLSLVSESKDIVKTESLKMLVMDEVNVKDVVFQNGASHILDLTITPELKKEGLVRDLIREIQDKRKEAGLSPKDSIRVEIQVSDETIGDFASEIGRSVNATVVDVKKSPAGDLSVVIKKI